MLRPLKGGVLLITQGPTLGYERLKFKDEVARVHTSDPRGKL